MEYKLRIQGVEYQNVDACCSRNCPKQRSYIVGFEIISKTQTQILLIESIVGEAFEIHQND